MPRGLLLLLALALYANQSAEAGGAEIGFSCRPALSVFCGNIHMACAGVTKIKTSPFNVSIVGTLATVKFESAERPRKGQVSGSGDLVIRLDDTRDWIRIQENDRYSHRIYRARDTAMSHGTCQRTPAH